MDFKGTKGKWESSKDEFDNSIISCNGYYLGEVRKEFDALLISKAPEMLEMLVKLKDSDLIANSRFEKQIEQLIKEATEIEK